MLEKRQKVNKTGQNEEITSQVRAIYNWLDREAGCLQNLCKTCGRCCDFAGFGHKLYVSSPEMMYFARNVTILPMAEICPYQKNGECSIYKHRFAGCRIFVCGSNPEKQAILSERALEKFKNICLTYDLDYFYTDLASALNS